MKHVKECEDQENKWSTKRSNSRINTKINGKEQYNNVVETEEIWVEQIWKNRLKFMVRPFLFEILFVKLEASFNHLAVLNVGFIPFSQSFSSPTKTFGPSANSGYSSHCCFSMKSFFVQNFCNWNQMIAYFLCYCCWWYCLPNSGSILYDLVSKKGKDISEQRNKMDAQGIESRMIRSRDKNNNK